MLNHNATKHRWFVQEGIGGFWSSLNKSGGHPNGATNSSNRQRINHWSVRRWIADDTGVLTLQGKLSKSNINGGNGTVAHIFVDGIEVFSQPISGNDGFGINYQFDVYIKAGSVIDFAIDPFNSDDISDGTNFTVRGDFSPSQTPVTIWLITLGLTGLIALIGMRKKVAKLLANHI